jgi:hypothetical protein
VVIRSYSMQVQKVYRPASLVFNATDEVLTRTLSTSAPSTTIYTVSAWVKSTATAGGVVVDSLNRPTNTNETGAANWNVNEALTMFTIAASVTANLSNTGNTLFVNDGTWHHYVWAYDSTQAVQADRSKIFIDGALQSVTQTTVISLNEANNLFTNGHTLEVGNQTGGLFTAKSLAFVEVLEGVAQAASAFAFSNGGTWTRKKYTGSYGTYGFFLDGSTGIVGADLSGNGQTFTGTNMDASNLSTSDLPPYTN